MLIPGVAKLFKRSRDDAAMRRAMADQLVVEIKRRVALEFALKSIHEHVWKTMADTNSDAVSGVELVNFIKALGEEIPVPRMGMTE